MTDEEEECLFFELLREFRRCRRKLRAGCDFDTLECNEAWRLFYREQLHIRQQLAGQSAHKLLKHVGREQLVEGG